MWINEMVTFSCHPFQNATLGLILTISQVLRLNFAFFPMLTVFDGSLEKRAKPERK